MRKEEVVGSKKKMQYQNLDTDPDPNPDTGRGVLEFAPLKAQAPLGL
jgi:hypothetical protein